MPFPNIKNLTHSTGNRNKSGKRNGTLAQIAGAALDRCVGQQKRLYQAELFE